jgi:hypothetical protein
MEWSTAEMCFGREVFTFFFFSLYIWSNFICVYLSASNHICQNIDSNSTWPFPVKHSPCFYRHFLGNLYNLFSFIEIFKN